MPTKTKTRTKAKTKKTTSAAATQKDRIKKLREEIAALKAERMNMKKACKAKQAQIAKEYFEKGLTACHAGHEKLLVKALKAAEVQFTKEAKKAMQKKVGPQKRKATAKKTVKKVARKPVKKTTKKTTKKKGRGRPKKRTS